VIKDQQLIETSKSTRKMGSARSAPQVSRTRASDSEAPTRPTRVFLLSPANAAGLRGRLIVNESAQFDLAVRLRENGLPLGELFSFISGLYLRGKLAYARAFAQAQPGFPGAFVITACQGLIPPEQLITLAEFRDMLAVPLEPANSRYRDPLDRDARTLAELAGKDCEVVLLGSIATPKYVEPLAEIFGERLVFPAEFVGRGDMSRGGLMLRCVRAGVPLSHVPVITAMRHGPKPPKLPPLPSGYLRRAERLVRPDQKWKQ